MNGNYFRGPGLVTDVAVTTALAVTTVACGGGVGALLVLTTTYTWLTDADPKKMKAA